MAIPKSIRFPDLLFSEITDYQKSIGETFTDTTLLLIKNGLSLAVSKGESDVTNLAERLDDVARLNVQIAALTNAIATESGGERMLEEAEIHATEMIKEMGL